MKKDIQNQILKILFEERKPVSSRGLALRCDVSVNTIRKEISNINSMSEQYGFRVESRASVGHYIEIFDEPEAESYLNDLYTRYRRTEYIPDEFTDTVQYIVRRLLCAPGPVSLEKLCKELYCSRSTLQRYLEKAKAALKRYDLQLTNRRGNGLGIDGCEWNKRQCLIYLHKAYALSMKEIDQPEYDFKNTFFLSGGINYSAHILQILNDRLFEQSDFFIPVIDIMTIVDYIILCASRKKYAKDYSFTPEQKAAAAATREYRFVNALREDLPSLFKDSMCEDDILAVTMLLLAFETDNRCLGELDGYEGIREETDIIAGMLTQYWDFPPEIIDDTFKEDCYCYLYTLGNRKFFNVYNDSEAASFVNIKGIRTADICIDFSRNYDRYHGYPLGENEKFSMFYMFQRITKKYTVVYYAQNILVVSRYGVQYARALVENLKHEYGKKIRSIAAQEYGELGTEDFEQYDLLVTDINSEDINNLIAYKMPVIYMNSYRGPARSKELDNYLKLVCRNTESCMIDNSCFRHTSFKDKEEVLEYFAKELSEETLPQEELLRHLHENDEYGVLDRGNGVVLLPVLCRKYRGKVKIMIAINSMPVMWDTGRSWIFVCYTRVQPSLEDHILNNILKRFVDISIEQTEKLVYYPEIDPMEVLYTDAEF